MTNGTKWVDLNDEQRYDYYYRKYHLGEDIDTLAKELDMNPETLGRYLRSQKSSIEKKELQFTTDEEELDKFDQVSTKFKNLDANNAEVSMNRNTRIKTVDQLLDACGVDKNEWAVESSEVRTWEGYRKAKSSQIEWVDGVANGWVSDSGGLHVETLYRVNAKLVRRKPVAVEPVITPVSFPRIKIETNNIWNPDVIRKTLIIPDIHVGFIRDLATGYLMPMHSREALQLIFAVLERESFDNIVLLGDNFDLADWSDKFLRSPDMFNTTQPAIEENAFILWKIRQAQPKARIYYIEGNHEKRLRDSIIRHVPQAYNIGRAGVVSNYSAWEIPHLLDLDALDIEWVGDYPNGAVWLEQDIVAVHGLQLSGIKALNKSDVSVIFGHIHRFECDTEVRSNGPDGKYNTYSYCPGFLGTDLVPAKSTNNRWSMGFGIVEHSDHTDMYIRQYNIYDGHSIVYDGMLMTAKDDEYLEGLMFATQGRYAFVK